VQGGKYEERTSWFNKYIRNIARTSSIVCLCDNCHSLAHSTENGNKWKNLLRINVEWTLKIYRLQEKIKAGKEDSL
jgi:predicted HNH restriction endonuclease